MNLATLSLTLFLKNPPQFSQQENLPLMILPNGRRIIIEQIDYEVTTLSDSAPRFITSYRLHRELGRYGEHQTLIGEFHSLEAISKVIADESNAPKEPRSVRYSFSPRG